MKVANRHDDYNKYLPLWKRVRDAVAGQDAVKKERTTYLPALNGQTPESYEAYLLRAVYTNFTKRTLQTALGQLFRKQPVVTEIDEDMLNDIDLNDTSFSFLTRQVFSEIMQTNRAGVWVDYDDQIKRTYLKLYKAENIINWKVENNSLTLVVLEGMIPAESKDVFEHKYETVWTVLLIDPETGLFTVREYKKNQQQNFDLVSEVVPMVQGSAVDYIPFYIVTQDGVSEQMENAPLLDFVDLNLAHYKNSADFENLLHWTGAKTIITRGFGDRAFPVGGAVDLPVDGGAAFLEASSDSGLRDELTAKENRMAVLGSSMISGKGRYVASAETQNLTSAGEYATLADISGAVSDAFSKILTFLNYWQTGSVEPVEVEFNKDFELAQLNTQDLIALMGAVQAGGLSWEAYYYQLKGREVYPQGWSMEDERAAIEKTYQEAMDRKKENFETFNINENEEEDEI